MPEPASQANRENAPDRIRTSDLGFLADAVTRLGYVERDSSGFREIAIGWNLWGLLPPFLAPDQPRMSISRSTKKP
jgi:hypothetical protein